MRTGIVVRAHMFPAGVILDSNTLAWRRIGHVFHTLLKTFRHGPNRSAKPTCMTLIALIESGLLFASGIAHFALSALLGID